MTDMGVLSHFLGIQFIFNDGVVEMNQRHYLEKLLCKYELEHCKPRSTSSEQKLEFSEDDEIIEVKRYREMVGSLIYAMTCTRPDLAWIVTKLSQYLSKPTKAHHVAVKHVFRYIKGTLNYALTFRKSSNKLMLHGYSDADWGSSEDRRSTTGYCFTLDNYSASISWKSQKQVTVALSTCEAEYMALASAAQEALFLIQLLCDLDGFDCHTDVVIHCDNQGAIALSQNPVHHKRSKHIDIRYHFIRSEVLSKRIKLEYVRSEENVADMLTKAMGKFKHCNLVKVLFGER